MGRQCEFRMQGKTAPEPCRGVAETFAAVLPPLAGTLAAVLRREGEFPPFRAPAKFAADVFAAQKFFIQAALWIAEPQPDEVPHFVYEDACEFRACTVKGNAAFAEKRSRVDRAAAVARPSAP